MKLELCIDSVEEAKVADKFKLDRIELCSALEVGGLTPSIGLTEACTALPHVETHVMIRPRGGNFTYSQEEVKIMLRDVKNLASAGVNGVVFGILDKNSGVDLIPLRELVSLAKSLNLEATFHRAFDLTKDPIESINKIIEIGFDRLLTSGQKETAIEGAELIDRLVEMANGRIQVMAGSGVNENNAKILQETGVDALHFTARKKSKANLPFSMGYDCTPDIEKIEKILNVLK